MPSEEKEILALIRVILSTETEPIIRTTTELVGPMSGDGHSFDDSYEEQEVEETVGHRAKYSREEKSVAVKRLRPLYKDIEDADLKALCHEALKTDLSSVEQRGSLGCVVGTLCLLIAAIAFSIYYFVIR